MITFALTRDPYFLHEISVTMTDGDDPKYPTN